MKRFLGSALVFLGVAGVFGIVWLGPELAWPSGGPQSCGGRGGCSAYNIVNSPLLSLVLVVVLGACLVGLGFVLPRLGGWFRAVIGRLRNGPEDPDQSSS